MGFFNKCCDYSEIFIFINNRKFSRFKFPPWYVLLCLIWSPGDFLWGLHKYFSDKCDCIFYFSATFNIIILLKNLSHPLSILSVTFANPPKQRNKTIHWWATRIKIPKTCLLGTFWFRHSCGCYFDTYRPPKHFCSRNTSPLVITMTKLLCTAKNVAWMAGGKLPEVVTWP